MNVVDSPGSLEYFADGPSAGFFASAIAKTDALIVPTLNLHEEFTRVLQQRDDNAALNAVALMQQATVVDLSAPFALSAAAPGAPLKRPLEDRVLYATARAYEATLWTQTSMGSPRSLPRGRAPQVAVQRRLVLTVTAGKRRR